MTARGISPHSEALQYPYDSPYADISLFGGFRAERLEAVNGAGKPGKVSQVVLGVESRACGAGKLPSEPWGLPQVLEVCTLVSCFP